MAGCVGVRKSDSLGRKAIDVRCFVKRASEATDVRPPQVINEKKDYIRRLRLSEAARKCDDKCEEYSFHGAEALDLGFGSTVQPGVLILP